MRRVANELSRRCLRSLALVVGVLAVVLPSTAAARLGPTTVAGAVRAWSPQFMDGSHPVTQAQAIADAKAFDVIAAHPGVFTPYLKAMRAANPKLQLFVYMKGTFTRDTTLPESDYAHDANGKRIYGLNFAGTWLLDPSSPTMISDQLALAQRLLAQSGYDGIFLDTIGTAPLHRGYVSAVPVDQSTGQPWTPHAWLAATSALAADIASTTGRPLMGNGLRNGYSFFAQTEGPTSALTAPGIAGAMAESWLREAGEPITSYPSESDWKQDVDLLAAAAARHTSIFAVTKLWTTGTTAQKSAWYTFAVASFLLGNDGDNYLSVSYDQGDLSVPRPLNHVDLGTPTGHYVKSGSVYVRGFSQGLVVVNPTAQPHVLTLKRHDFKTLAAKPIRVVSLAPHSAVLLKLPPTAAKKKT